MQSYHMMSDYGDHGVDDDDERMHENVAIKITSLALAANSTSRLGSDEVECCLL